MGRKKNQTNDAAIDANTEPATDPQKETSVEESTDSANPEAPKTEEIDPETERLLDELEAEADQELAAEGAVCGTGGAFGDGMLAEPVSDRRAYRLSLRAKEKYIIDDHFPAGLMHIVAGASGMGKTTWLFQILHDWSMGRKVLGGKKSHPCKWIYVSADRTTLETDRTLRRLGLGDWNIPSYAIEELQDEPDLMKLYHRFQSVDLFIIEGLQAFVPDAGKQSQNRAEFLWMIKLRKAMLSHGKTIIGSVHQPKGTDMKMATHSRNSIIGSASLVGCAGTIVTLDYADGVSTAQKDTGERVVTIEPKDAPKASIRYRRGDGGIFEEISQEEAEGQYGGLLPDDYNLDALLTAHLITENLSMHILKLWMMRAQVSWSTLKRWIQKKVNSGELVKAGRGDYRKTTKPGR